MSRRGGIFPLCGTGDIDGSQTQRKASLLEQDLTAAHADMQESLAGLKELESVIAKKRNPGKWAQEDYPGE
ncbi:MAG: hypothetical protein ACLR23_05545 [Clostridia bacterium]